MNLLSPFATAIYRPLMEKRRAKNLARRQEAKAPCPILSIGNLTTGGTGKTPAVQWAAKFLQQQGYQVGIASRGYGGSLSAHGALVSDGLKILLTASEAGDEPILHAQTLPEAIVAIAQDRHLAVELAVKQGAQVVLLDDGFQFWSLPRACDVVLLDAAKPFGNGMLLPAGRLREERGALSRADAIILTRANRATAAQLAGTRNEVALWTKAPIFEAVHAPLELRDEKTGALMSLEELQGQQISAIAAIADNLGFKAQLEELGATVQQTYFKSDHYNWAKNPLPRLAGICVTTEKDATKLDPDNFSGQLLSLRIGLQIRDNERALQELIIQKLEAVR